MTDPLREAAQAVLSAWKDPIASYAPPAGDWFAAFVGHVGPAITLLSDRLSEAAIPQPAPALDALIVTLPEALDSLKVTRWPSGFTASVTIAGYPSEASGVRTTWQEAVYDALRAVGEPLAEPRP